MLVTSRPRSTSAAVRTASEASVLERLTAYLVMARRIMFPRMYGLPWVTASSLRCSGRRVLRQDAGPLVGGQKTQREGAALAAQLQVTIGDDEDAPGEAAVAADLLGAQKQPAQALRRPAAPEVHAVVPRRPLPERHADRTDQGQGQDQQGPFSGLSLRAGDCHGVFRQGPGHRSVILEEAVIGCQVPRGSRCPGARPGGTL